MRALKSFSLGFGMVSVPVKLYSATDDKRKSLPVHQYHARKADGETCGSRIKKPNWCPECEAMLEADDIIKGYEIDSETFIPITADDYEHLKLESLSNIQVEAFIDIDYIDEDPRWLKDSYFLAPDEVGAKAFCLFRDAMEQADVVGIAKMTLRDKEHLVSIRPFRGLIILNTMHWADELRDGDDLVPYATVTDQEKEMALSLIKGMKPAQFDLGKYKDEWFEAFEELVKAKYEGREIEIPEVKPKQTEADLAKQLLESLNAIKV